jgi:hypothetical protein
MALENEQHGGTKYKHLYCEVWMMRNIPQDTFAQREESVRSDQCVGDWERAYMAVTL